MDFGSSKLAFHDADTEVGPLLELGHHQEVDLLECLVNK